jgi:hypothetical protein
MYPTGYQLTNQGQSEARTGATGSGNIFNIGGNPNVAQFAQTLGQLGQSPAVKYALIAAAVALVLGLVWRASRK